MLDRSPAVLNKYRCRLVLDIWLLVIILRPEENTLLELDFLHNSLENQTGMSQIIICGFSTVHNKNLILWTFLIHKTKGVNLLILECKNNEWTISLNEKFVSSQDTYIFGLLSQNIACVWFDLHHDNSQTHSVNTPSLIYRRMKFKVTRKETKIQTQSMSRSLLKSNVIAWKCL